MLSLITGSGFYDIPELQQREPVEVGNPFGPPVVVTTGTWHGVPIAFLGRHGSDHSVPPHAINFRANIFALKEVGATSILATAVSGGIAPEMEPGALVIISDFLNFSSGRAVTFFDGSGLADGLAPDQSSGPVGVIHTDMSAAYDPDLRSLIAAAAEGESISVIDGGVYCTTDGPRFETPAEIQMMKTMGGDLVGMTGYPEVALAVEAGLRYASIGVISNLAAGISLDPLSVDDVVTLIKTTAEPLYRLIGATVGLYAQSDLS